jgi:hypothetical protein
LTRCVEETDERSDVKIDFVGNVASLYGTVLHRACDTGDCWRIRGDQSDGGRIHYVQNFEQMILLKKAE